MISKITWGIFIFIFLTFFFYILLFYRPKPAGDIVEYYGMTTSLLHHGDVSLSSADRKEIEKVLPSAYFSDPQYYIAGSDGNRYPVHFVFYSYLLLPIKVILSLFGINPLLVFSFTNLIILAISVIIVWKQYVHDSNKRIILLLLILFSPILSFITWPGPDLLYACLILLAIFAFFGRQYFLSAILAAIASWQSQPLFIIALGISLFIILPKCKKDEDNSKKNNFANFTSTILQIFIVFSIIIFPYLYNYLQFGVATPWTIIQNGWTREYGFGFQNIRAGKLLEQIFDPNMGLMWYAPLSFFLGITFLLKNIGNKKIFYIIILFLITAFFYQTNPAWHYGTAGFGPSRHVLFLIPLFIIFSVSVTSFNKSKRNIAFFLTIILWQLYSLAFNGFLAPDFTRVLFHNPYASFLLDNYPTIYNPTPEIYVDRTNHNDLDHLTSAYYKKNAICKKVFLMKKDSNDLIGECGYIPVTERVKFQEEIEKIKPYEGIYINY